MILLNAFKDTPLYRSLTEGLGKRYKDADSEAAACFHDLKVPSYVKQVLNIGCGAGRNFRPYNFLYKLWGIDVVPYQRVKWVAPFSNLRYEQLSVEQLTKILNRDDIDLSKTLIISDCVLMHVPEADQLRFYLEAKKCGCRNFIFREPSPDDVKHPYRNFKLPLDEFTQHRPMNDRTAVYAHLEY
jgi:SAM-dependent methyltransferase